MFFKDQPKLSCGISFDLNKASGTKFKQNYNLNQYNISE